MQLKVVAFAVSRFASALFKAPSISFWLEHFYKICFRSETHENSRMHSAPATTKRHENKIVEKRVKMCTENDK